jgi:hypothetical protein
MTRFALCAAFLGLAIAACSSSDSNSAGSSTSSSSGSGACPNLAATWKVTAHCDPSLIGQNAVVTQTGCNLTFAAPFNGFTGTVTADDKLTVTGPQQCTGTATASAIQMSCTPGTCTVTLAR